ncbi:MULTISPECIES: nitroreductase family protein [unclassified Polaromonas]|jgi:nitroreductase|uniref:nitroreductase family protein n=1 Tax=unclassified Polaromonas TaxID=2638319 RepID=UPI000BD3FB9D|nr:MULTISPECIES: nitroreductase family protein [unclassified Polaromonas]OYY37932.1 MAG: nitroreductase family protein [Polaromonas sp. 35-63-35]OYZ21113.1 MAG: nitroreductase family protein [Polaromonas sp. 16-63-31]OYZ79480.1 MAG: nitroreductase family protein [Polaromonas sp. 24-63-21]OZA50625.1 MAG: nitroreductase family protein [Polaromonas sp. 17-63-33]OZA89485.1 MAG: nitroreductase family protein [Polaromonas sp. 39-63-25]
MIHPTITLIEQRTSVNHFDAEHRLSDTEIEQLVRLATRAPTAYNLQNWRFIAVRTPAAKALLHDLAHGQAKVLEAAVTFIVCGQLPNHLDVPQRLLPFIDAGYMSEAMASAWKTGVRTQYADPRIARDEAVRSATFGAATLIFAAEAMGLATGPMGGFDADSVAGQFGLTSEEIPVMLVAVGRAAGTSWPQKPRRPLAEVLGVA